jgi:c-di-GMP-binding flagellar brake protein YcgR
MANLDQPPPRPSMETGADDTSKYLVESQKEVVYILRAIMHKGEKITAHFNQGNGLILTAILDVSAENNWVILDYGGSEALNRKILEAGKIIFIMSQDKVRVQFTAPHIKKISYQGKPAFKIDLPESLIKLQRREYFRLETPIARHLTCTFPLEDGENIGLTIVDLSIGGLGIANPTAGYQLKIGKTYQGCHFILPEIGTIVTALQVRNAFEVTLKNGTHAMRTGCMFVNLPGTMQSMIQRYIIKLERERRALQVDDD